MANYLVMTVKAVDNDTGDNGKIKYHLQVPIYLEPFIISSILIFFVKRQLFR